MDFVFDPSPVLYLPLYQLDGASFMSKDKHGHLCTVTGALWRPSGRYFDGTDDKIDCGTNVAPSIGTSDFTFEVWFDIDPTMSGYGGIVCWGLVAAEEAAFLIFYHTNNNYTIHMRDGTNAFEDDIVTNVLTNYGDATHIIVSVDRDGDLFALANGVETLRTTSHQTVGSMTTTYPTYIGTYGNEGTPTGVHFVKGVVGEARIYTRALNPLEAQHNYLATKWRYR